MSLTEDCDTREAGRQPAAVTEDCDSAPITVSRREIQLIVSKTVPRTDTDGTGRALNAGHLRPGGGHARSVILVESSSPGDR